MLHCFVLLYDLDTVLHSHYSTISAQSIDALYSIPPGLSVGTKMSSTSFARYGSIHSNRVWHDCCWTLSGCSAQRTALHLHSALHHQFLYRHPSLTLHERRHRQALSITSSYYAIKLFIVSTPTCMMQKIAPDCALRQLSAESRSYQSEHDTDSMHADAMLYPSATANACA